MYPERIYGVSYYGSGRVLSWAMPDESRLMSAIAGADPTC
jgi:hypothetical protein